MTQPILAIGKLDPLTLKRLVFSRLGKHDSRVLLGPKIGEDATVIDFGDRALIVHSDPITGAVENVGWLAVNVCTNDIATRGVRPKWILTVLLLPENFALAELKNITAQIDKAAKQLGIAVVGGHSEITSGLNRPIIITTAIGETVNKNFVQTSGAKIGDALILTKGAAIEGTAILAHELGDLLEAKIGKKLVEKAKQFIRKTSVVKDALTAIEVGEEAVHAMHDATEGGVASGLQEIAWASNVGLVAYEQKIPLHPETEVMCQALGIDPLRTISSGTLIISAESQKAEEIVSSLKQEGIKAAVIGKVLNRKKGAYIVRKNGTKLDLSKPVKEELWKALETRLKT
ncbi:MAG: AIR synthase family protein [Candidatus Bathyarchaeia archaeon]